MDADGHYCAASWMSVEYNNTYVCTHQLALRTPERRCRLVDTYLIVGLVSGGLDGC